MKIYPFKTAYTQARELYGIELKIDEFETLGLIAWDKIGNKFTTLYKYQQEPIKSPEGLYYIDLPCNADIVEAVTADYEDYQKTNSMRAAGETRNGWTEGYIETRKYNTSFGYIKGKFIKYRQEDNRIYLADKFDIVNVVYAGVKADEEGLPSLSSGELDAIAAFCAYSYLFKQGLMTRDSNTIQLAQLLENKWKLMCTQARVPEYINQNEMDEILNVSSSWDRKRFGKSYKPMR